MPKDGTQIINPNGKTMYLVLSGRRGSGAERSQTKVTSIREASEQTISWFKRQGIYRSDVRSSHVHVGGMVVAKVGTDGKVYRVDPFTQVVYGQDKPDRVLYDPEAYQNEIVKEEQQREARGELRRKRDAILVEFFRKVYDAIMPEAREDGTLVNSDELHVFYARHLSPTRSDNASAPRGLKLRFEKRLSSGITANIVMGINIAGFSREDRYETFFSVEGGMSSNNAVNAIESLDQAIEFYSRCKRILTILKTTLDSDDVKASFDAYNASRVELERDL